VRLWLDGCREQGSVGILIQVQGMYMKSKCLSAWTGKDCTNELVRSLAHILSTDIQPGTEQGLFTSHILLAFSRPGAGMISSAMAKGVPQGILIRLTQQPCVGRAYVSLG